MDTWRSHIWRGDKLVEWESRVWQPSDDARLTRLWAEGISTARIGTEITRTKSAVIGRARRLSLLPRLSPLPTPPKPKAVQAAAKPPRRPRKPGVLQLATEVVDGPRLAPPAPKPPRTHPPAPAVSPKPEILPPVARPHKDHTPPVAFRTCQWIDSDDPPWVMCGAPTLPRCPYCKPHRDRAWVITPRFRALEAAA